MDPFFHLEFDSSSENEAFARAVVCAFAARLDPTVQELEDIRTAISEAVTNAIIHGYDQQSGTIWMRGCLHDRLLTVSIEDHGIGMEDVPKAMEAKVVSCGIRITSFPLNRSPCISHFPAGVMLFSLEKAE